MGKINEKSKEKARERNEEETANEKSWGTVAAADWEKYVEMRNIEGDFSCN
jgi:hypothetical protein